MINIYQDEETVIRHCEFIKKHTKVNTNSKVVREAVRQYYVKLKDDKRQELINKLEDLEK